VDIGGSHEDTVRGKMVSGTRDPAVIRLKVLGAIDARGLDGQPLQPLLAQPRRLALLVFVVIESADGACPRERLLAAFWPDHPPEQASANLRQSLAFLRRVLGEGVVLGVGQHALRVERSRLWCDAVDASAGERAAAGELLQGLHLDGVGEAWESWLFEQRNRLSGLVPPSSAAADPPDAAARAAYRRGLFHWSRRPRESAKALASLEEAVHLAPDFAPAHAALADVYNTLGSWESGALPSTDAFPKARAAALRALQLDPCCAAAHTSLAYANAHYEWQWSAAEEQFRRALALDPGYAHAHHWRAHLLVAQRRFGEALEESHRALELQPVDVIINVHLAWHHWLAREPEAAIEQADRTAQLDDTDHWPPFFRGMACTMCSREADAVEALRHAAQLSRGNAVMRAGLGYVYAACGDARQARLVLREFSAAAALQHRYAYEAAVIHAALGEHGRALDLLDQAYDARSAWMAYAGVDPRLDVLRSEPRLQQLLQRLGLPAG
jgi:tetratricopeptide (TPR) repeat protein